jgi:peroxin-2
MFSLSMFKTGATYGLQLMGLKYRDERQHWNDPVNIQDAFPTLAQRFGWWLGHIGLKYAWTRIHRVSLREQWSDLENHHWKKKLWRLMEWLEKVQSVLTLLNFLVFLSNGRFEDLLH